jgi:hypothetical protein
MVLALARIEEMIVDKLQRVGERMDAPQAGD